MSKYHVEVTDVVPASPEQVYAILIDYREGHPAILPKPYFEDLTVLEGGLGAGTVVEVQMNVSGVRRVFRLTTSEPEPGRVLREIDETAGVTTTFTVDSVNGGKHARVTISTEAKTQQGLMGLLEKLFTPGITRRIYQLELKQLGAYAQSKQAT